MDRESLSVVVLFVKRIAICLVSYNKHAVTGWSKGEATHRPLRVRFAKLSRSQSPAARNPPAASFRPLTLSPPPFWLAFLTSC